MSLREVPQIPAPPRFFPIQHNSGVCDRRHLDATEAGAGRPDIMTVAGTPAIADSSATQPTVNQVFHAIGVSRTRTPQYVTTLSCDSADRLLKLLPQGIVQSDYNDITIPFDRVDEGQDHKAAVAPAPVRHLPDQRLDDRERRRRYISRCSCQRCGACKQLGRLCNEPARSSRADTVRDFALCHRAV